MKHSMQNRFVRQYDGPDGTKTLEFANSPLIYQDDDGNWFDISPDFVETESGYIDKTNALQTIIKADPAEPYNVVYRSDNGYKVEIDLRELRYVSEEGIDVIATPQAASSYLIHDRNDTSTVVQAHIFPGVIDEYQTVRSQLIHNMYFQVPPRPPKITGNVKLEIYHKVRVNRPATVRISSGTKTDDFYAVTPIELVDQETDEIVVLDKPTLVDASGNNLIVLYKFEFLSEQEFGLSYLINYSSLIKPYVKYPLLLDPTASVYASGGSTKNAYYEIQFPQTIYYDILVAGHSGLYAKNDAYAWIKDPAGYTFIQKYQKGSGHAPASGTRYISMTGTGQIRVYGRSYANANAKVTYVLDETAPTIDITSHADNSNIGYVRNASLTFKGTASDSQSGVSRVTGKCEGAWSAGEFNVTTSSPTSWSYSRSFPQGYSKMSFRAQDKVGNWSVWRYVAFTVDTVAPSVSFSPSSRGWSNSNISVTVTASDATSGVSKTEYSWSNSTSPGTWSSFTNGTALTKSGNGTWYLHIRATDKAGNVKTTYAGPYRKETTAPTISFSKTSQTTYTNQAQNIKVTCADSGGSGLSATRYAWSQSTTTPSSWTNFTNGGTLTQSATGNWYLHIRAQDGAGNVRTSYAGPYRIDATLPNNPAVKVTGSTETSVSLSWTVGDSGGSGVDRAVLYFQRSDSAGNHVADIDIDGNGSTEFSLNVGTSTSYTVNGLAPWTYYRYYVRVYDKAGNQKNDGYYVVRTPDTTNPAINITSHTDNSNLGMLTSSTLGFSGTASDNVLVKRVVGNSNGAWETGDFNVDTSSPTSWTYTHTFPEGFSRMNFRAQDDAGNWSPYRYVEFTIDTIAPTITFEPTSRGWGNTDIGVKVTANDATTGVKTTKYSWSTGTTPGTWVAFANGSTLTQSSDGTWYLHIQATDNAGNVFTNYKGPYRKDAVNPTHSSHSLTGYRYKLNNNYYVRPGDTVQITMVGADERSGLARNYLRLSSTNGDDARAWYGFDNGSFDEYQTATYVDIQGAVKNSAVSTTFTVKVQSTAKDGDVYQVRGWHWDRAGNWLSNFDTGMRLIVDAAAPTMTGWSISGHRYYDGSIYWGQPGDQMKFRLSGRDTVSGPDQGYIQLVNKLIGGAEHASYRHGVGYMADSREDDHIDVTNGREISCNGTDMTVEFDFTLLTKSYTYDLRWYWYDCVRHGRGYSDTGKDIGIDGTSPKITAYPESRPPDPSIIWVNITATDSESGLKSLKYKWSGSEHYSDSNMVTAKSGENISYDGGGTAWLHVRSEDNAGNVSKATYGPYTRISEPAGYTVISTPGGPMPVPWFGLDKKINNSLRIQVTPTQTGCFGLVPCDSLNASLIHIQTPRGIMAIEKTPVGVFGFSSILDASEMSPVSGFNYGKLQSI